MSPPSPFATNSAAVLLRQQQQQQTSQGLPPGATTGYVVQPDAAHLHRHASLPTRRPFSPETQAMGPPPMPLARRPSHRPAGQLSISEDAEVVHADVNLGRSKSWRPTREDDWRYEQPGPMLSRGVSTSASDPSRQHYRHAHSQGHARSHSGASQLTGSTEPSPLESTFANTAYLPRTTTTLHKSASLRSTASQSSVAPSHGHSQPQGGYARSVLTRGRGSPGSASLNWDHLASPMFAKSEDNHGIQMARLATREEEPPRGIPGPLVGMSDTYHSQATQRIQSEAQGADVRRHQSLQQGFGHSTKVQERLARSQALLPPEQRTAYGADRESGERERRTSDLSARNVWGTGTGVGGNDGWAQVDTAMRARANHTPVNTNAVGRRETRTQPTGEFSEPLQDPYQAGVQRDSLMQAFQAMQLGNEMLGPAVVSEVPAVPNLADVYRSSLMTYGQTNYDADYGYPRALGPLVDAGLSYPGYTPVVPPTPFPTFPTTAAVNTPAPYHTGVPFTQSLSQSSHSHAQAPPVVPDHIARAAEAEVNQMIASRHLNPVDFHCEPENASRLPDCCNHANSVPGPLLCHQIIHRGRRAQVAQA